MDSKKNNCRGNYMRKYGSYLISYVERYGIACDWVNIIICFMKLFYWSNAIDFIQQSRITVPKMRPSHYYWQTGIATIKLKQPRFAKLIAIFKQPFICRFTWFQTFIDFWTVAVVF